MLFTILCLLWLNPDKMNTIQTSVLKAIAYFDIFNYPLSASEIQTYMDTACSREQVQSAINELIKEKIIFKSKEFYSLQCDDEQASRRIRENIEAEKQLLKANKIALIITKFPFIKAVAISGSLSKNVARKDSDFDFFIITKANRLWVSRLFFTCLVKAARLVGFERCFCPNYVVDEEYLEVQEKNIFTATEIITLKPIYGQELFKDFFAANIWVQDFFPNNADFEKRSKEIKSSFPAKCVEWIFKGNFGERADNSILKFCQRRWEKMMSKKKYTKTGFQLGAVLAEKHFCRPLPQHFQKKILDKHKEKIDKIINNITAQYTSFNDQIFVA